MSWPPDSMPTIRPTVTRVPRIQGFPPMTAGLRVMRWKVVMLFSPGWMSCPIRPEPVLLVKRGGGLVPAWRSFQLTEKRCRVYKHLNTHAEQIHELRTLEHRCLRRNRSRGSRPSGPPGWAQG